MYEYLISLRVEGVDTREELNELVAFKKKQAVEIERNSADVRKYVKLFSKQSVKKNFPSLFRFIKTIAGDVIARSVDDEILGPDQTGVENVLEAARFLESRLPSVQQ